MLQWTSLYNHIYSHLYYVLRTNMFRIDTAHPATVIISKADSRRVRLRLLSTTSVFFFFFYPWNTLNCSMSSPAFFSPTEMRKLRSQDEQKAAGKYTHYVYTVHSRIHCFTLKNVLGGLTPTIWDDPVKNRHGGPLGSPSREEGSCHGWP